ncbi:hypothetical protein SOVF_069090 isoform C [Spinacia oleracea]|nr:hypothetical protein SOVF_069090 isoform C [Spinacia oleracea]
MAEEKESTSVPLSQDDPEDPAKAPLTNSNSSSRESSLISHLTDSLSQYLAAASSSFTAPSGVPGSFFRLHQRFKVTMSKQVEEGVPLAGSASRKF